jgi:hypothetical protein
MTDAAIAGFATLVQILAECLVATTTGVELSTITTTATTTATTSSRKRRTITASSGRAEGNILVLTLYFHILYQSSFDLTHPPLRQRRAMLRKRKVLI